MTSADDLLRQITYNTNPGPAWERDPQRVTQTPPVRLIAFYLPQFHPIPENNKWWGEGFTEWTNVSKAIPRFEGHYQPRLPAALGFYDLRNIEILEAQAKMAKAAGVHGFCFYYYWFAGKRLLERPLDMFRANSQVDIPFCICWANENWTRRWDGEDRQILIAQDHSPEDDIRIAESMAGLVEDARYIKIDGRPLIILYRPAKLPDSRATLNRWRDVFEKRGLSSPFFVMVRTHGQSDPEDYGFDAAIGFPPNFPDHQPRGHVKVSSYEKNFSGTALSYDALAQNWVDYQYHSNVFPGVTPGWDNDARRPGKGLTFTGSTPMKYGHWLRSACKTAMNAPTADRRLVFVNAWNEWAEGAYLEPDRHFGYAYLNETARALSNFSSFQKNGLDLSSVGDLSTPPVLAAGRRTFVKVANGLDRISAMLRSL